MHIMYTIVNRAVKLSCTAQNFGGLGTASSDGRYQGFQFNMISSTINEVCYNTK